MQPKKTNKNIRKKNRQMASRSSSPSPGQSGQDDRDDDADSASGRNLPPVHDE